MLYNFLKRNKLIILLLFSLVLFFGCSSESDYIIFNAIIDEVYENHLVVSTINFKNFDKALVYINSDTDLDFKPLVGEEIEVKASNKITKSYPAKINALKIKLINKSGVTTYEKISSKVAKDMINSGGVIILDVRTKEEYDEGHIMGAILIPEDQIRDKASEILTNKESTILVYCRSGRRSELAAKELVNLGYTNIYDFGGLDEWDGEIVK